jgi:hypothetical protein
MNDDTFVCRSRAGFAEHFPQVMDRIKKGSPVSSSVVTENGEPVDICVDGQLIYGGNAHRFANGQVAAFIEKPLRFFVQRLDLSGIVTAVGKRLIDTIEKGLRSDAFGECTTQPMGNPTFLIVLGLGLGHHLNDLISKTQARWVIIVEPLVEFFEHSFHVVDWAGLVADVKGNGGSVHIITDIEPEKIVKAISGVVLREGIPYADGSWVFTHYPLWAFSEARNRLHEAIEFAFINRGFYEDELVMMRNAVENCATRDFWLVEGRPRLCRRETAVIVAAGPSLDEGIETLQRIRDRVVIFSAGTALRALLRNGIVPDFHCELENVNAVCDALAEAAKFGDLSQITLIASATVHPRVPPLFRDIIFYFRDSVSPTQILARKHREIYATSPTCANLALTVSGFMGFTEFALFGTDCGTRPGGARHAKGTVYNDVAQFEVYDRPHSHILEVDGNFGGTIHTDHIYDSCRVMLADSIKHLGLKVRNCSDGALIEHAQPCVPDALEISAPVVDRSALTASLQATMQRYAPGEILEEADLDLIRRNTKTLFADLDKLLVELGDGETDFAGAYDRVMAFVKDANDRYGYTESIISGSLQALPRIAMFYGFRIADAAGRRKLFDVFIAEFRDILAFMAVNITALFDGIEVHTPTRVAAVAAGPGR